MQNLQRLQQQLDELHKDHEKLLELHTSFDMFLKVREDNIFHTRHLLYWSVDTGLFQRLTTELN